MKLESYGSPHDQLLSMGPCPDKHSLGHDAELHCLVTNDGLCKELGVYILSPLLGRRVTPRPKSTNSLTPTKNAQEQGASSSRDVPNLHVPH